MHIVLVNPMEIVIPESSGKMKHRIFHRWLFILLAVLMTFGTVGVFILDYSILLLWILGGVWIGIMTVALFVYPKRQKELFFSKREPLSEEDIYRQYFLDSGLSQPIVLELWSEVAKTLGIPVGKLRPADRFGQELGGYWFVGDELDVLSKMAIDRVRRSGAVLDLSKITTLDEYIKILATLIQKSKGGQDNI